MNSVALNLLQRNKKNSASLPKYLVKNEFVVYYPNETSITINEFRGQSSNSLRNLQTSTGLLVTLHKRWRPFHLSRNCLSPFQFWWLCFKKFILAALRAHPLTGLFITFCNQLPLLYAISFVSATQSPRLLPLCLAT